MGGVVDGGGGIGLKTYPCRAAIEMAQAELRQEYDVREERRRELEFLEKGGNPLDFKFGIAASISVQSTSLTNHKPEHSVISEPKGSFALAASPHGDSVESIDKPGAPTGCEPNSADNLTLFYGDNDTPEGERSLRFTSRNSVAPSEQSSQMYGTDDTKEPEDSAIVRPYAHRNRSRPSREGSWSNSAGIAHSVQGSSLPINGGPNDTKEMKSEINNKKDMNISSDTNLRSTNSNGGTILNVVASDKQLTKDLDGAQELEMKAEPVNGSLPGTCLDIVAPKTLEENQHSEPCQTDPLPIPIFTISAEADILQKEQLVSGGQQCLPSVAKTNSENETTCVQKNGFNDLKSVNKSTLNEVQKSCAAVDTKGSDSKSSCTKPCLGLDVHNESDMFTYLRNTDSDGNTMVRTLEIEGIAKQVLEEAVQEKHDKPLDGGGVINNHHSSVCQNDSPIVKGEEDINPNRSELHNKIKSHSDTKQVQQSGNTVSLNGRNIDVLDDNSSIEKEIICTDKLQDPQHISRGKLSEAVLSARDSTMVSEPQSVFGSGLKVVDKAHEDSILEEAQTIEVKHRRIIELSVPSLTPENRRKSHWDLVLEEMSWMAKDFAQERLWKIVAASQICRRVAFDSRLRLEQKYQSRKLREKAYAMAKAVIQFWHLAEQNLNGDDLKVCPEKCECTFFPSTGSDQNDVSKHINDGSNTEPSKEEPQHPRKNLAFSVQDYALRCLKYNSSLRRLPQAEAPATPDWISDFGILKNSWGDNLSDLTEENLFYTVPSGAMEVYRKSIESHVMQREKTGISVQEKVDTSYDAVAEYGLPENAHIKDEGVSTYFLNGTNEGCKSLKLNHKKRKHLMESYTPRSFEPGTYLPYEHYNATTQQSMLMGKRPASLIVGPIPTKRMRTASRQRVLSPFSAVTTGSVEVQIKTDASSGDTSSCQDDQGPLHGGSQFQKSVEVESAGDFDKQLPYESAEISVKPKKKAKHLGSTYDQGWPMHSAMFNDQRENSKRRIENHHFESNGLHLQHDGKKPKISKPLFENTFDNMAAVTGSVPSPVSSQNNMPHTNKILKLFGGRDRGRKAKSSKMPVGQPESGSPWTLFEDQALVVLVHDMGPNWELISDAINSSLHFKCIFRKPNECKERHKILMDKSAGDGGDSAEDSGSSQPYPSTLPGIPKGSARQLFQRLQEPMEEDIIKSHFEKIIKIGQKLHYCRSQNENQDPKQIAPIHNSHIIALSQVCPNNLTGGILTPFDLCEADVSSSDVLSLGYQDSHASGLAISNQGTFGANSSLQGSSGMVLGGNLSSPSASQIISVRDGRYNVPRTSSASVEEQQRMQHFNQMLSSRSIQQSTWSVPGGVSGTDRGVRVLPGGSGMGMMCGMNRNMPISRPGFQGMVSSPMLNSGSILSSSMAGMANPGAGSSHGNSMMRPREALHIMRPIHNPEQQRQIRVPELQMQVTQANSQGITPFNGMSAAFSCQTTPPPVQSYQGRPQQQHQVSPQQSHALGSSHHPHSQGPNHTSGSPAFAIHLAKERQRHMQQQQQQQQQFAVSSTMMSHVQPQPHLPMSTLQNSSQIQSQTSQPLSLSPLTPSSGVTPLPAQHQQKHHLPPHGLNRNPSSGGLASLIGNQWRQPQQQQHQQSGRHHPQQQQHAQPQQQAKPMKGVGRSMVHQNLPVDLCNLNGLSVAPGSQQLEKGKQICDLNGLSVAPGSQQLENGKQVMQGQGVYSGSGLNPIQPTKPLISQSPNHSQLQQKLNTSPAPSPKQLQNPHSDNSSQGQVSPAFPCNALSTSHQAVPTTIASTHQQVQSHLQTHEMQVNQTQTSSQRMLQHNRQVNSELPNKSQTEKAQADQHSDNTCQVGVKMAMPQSSIDSAPVVPVLPAVTVQLKSSEPAYDSNAPNLTLQSSSAGSPPLASSAGTESMPPISQGLGPRQLSGSLPTHDHSVGRQWQQKQLPPKQPLTVPSQPPQQYLQHEQQAYQKSPRHQLSMRQQPQQKMQHMQATEGSLYLQSSTFKPE